MEALIVLTSLVLLAVAAPGLGADSRVVELAPGRRSSWPGHARPVSSLAPAGRRAGRVPQRRLLGLPRAAHPRDREDRAAA